jgi:hypothetical protein
MSKVAIGLRIEPDLLAAVDGARGDVPRTRWIERAIRQALDAPATQDKAAQRDRAVRARKPAEATAELPKIAPRHWAR